VKLSSTKRRIVIAAAAILLGLFLLRPGISGLKARIATSISRAVARPVQVGSVHLRFLPPGFDLQNLVVDEDPAFGAEPMLRAPEVSAAVRLSSLVRGRLDIARLELTEPSLNLVLRPDGRWNWEALLERTARMPLAPTAKSKSEARPGFPYIEATSGRINFKVGPEKKPYALLNADFAVWQESENAWGVRLNAQPLRTDVTLSDTGLLRMSGIWQRAGSLRETPMQFSATWDHAQLGQLTKLISGADKGWRGEVRLNGTADGTPAALKVMADMSIQNFHRYDISSSEGLRLAAHCNGSYNSAESVMHEVLCNAPVGEGMITLRGNAGLPGVHKLDLSLNLDGVPANAVAQLARRAKKNLPPDLVSSGSVRGDFAASEDAASSEGPEFLGRGEITNLRMRSLNTGVEFAPGSVPFVLRSGGGAVSASSKAMPLRQREGGVLQAPAEMHIEYGPFPVALGRPLAAQAKGWVGRSGYGMTIRGEGEVSHALRLASLLGLPAVKASVEGVAQMDLQIAGSWAGNIAGAESGFSLPEVTGTAHLRNVRAAVRGINGPVEISAAELKLSPDGVRVEKLKAEAADAAWTGSMAFPRGCGTPGACVIRFNLTTEEVGLGNLHEWLASQPRERRWYQMLSPAETQVPSFLQNLRASGTISAGRLLIRNLIASNVSASLDLERGNLKVSDCRADLLGGKHRGDWQIDFATGSPAYAGTGTLTAIALEQIADAMQDPWISGTAAGTYQITASGVNSADFWQSAIGSLQFDLRDGVLTHISLGDEGPLHVTRWQGRAGLRGGKFEIEQGRLVAPTGAYDISGTTSLGRELDLKLAPASDIKARSSARVYRITGTVAEPLITLTPAPETQAQLKP
jgi:hypothetical protein